MYCPHKHPRRVYPELYVGLASFDWSAGWLQKEPREHQHQQTHHDFGRSTAIVPRYVAREPFSDSRFQKRRNDWPEHPHSKFKKISPRLSGRLQLGNCFVDPHTQQSSHSAERYARSCCWGECPVATALDLPQRRHVAKQRSQPTLRQPPTQRAARRGMLQQKQP